MFGQSQDDITLCQARSKSLSTRRSQSKIDLKQLSWFTQNHHNIGSMPNLNKLQACDMAHFNQEIQTIRQYKDSSSVSSNLETAELCLIANEIHSKFSGDDTPHFGTVLNNINKKQYHSWPKQYNTNKSLTATFSYHNFGLNHGLSSLSKQLQSVKNSTTVSTHSPGVANNLEHKNAKFNDVSRHGSKVHRKSSMDEKSITGNDNEHGKNKPIDLHFSNVLEEFNINNNDNSLAETHSSSSCEDSDWDSGLGQLPELNPLRCSFNGIAPPLFKKRNDLILQWFTDFSDEQKNVFIQNILDSCRLPQMHMLSLKMEPILHCDCPENCRDMLQWLPENVVYHILGYLDAISLSNAHQVNRTWYHYTSHENLWHRFCRYPMYRLSTVRHHEQIEKYKLQNGRIQWRKIFVERYSCKRNWMKGKCKVKTFFGHTQGVSCVQFDSKRIVSGSSDKTIKVWDLTSASSDPVLTLVGHSGTVRCLQLSGNRLISGSADATIKVWDLSVGSDWNMAACRVTMIGHLDTVRCLQVDNEKVISGSYDMTLKVWTLKTGQCHLTLRGHNAAVLCVQFDDEKIVSGSADKSIKVWNLFDGLCLATLRGHLDAVTCLQFNHHKIISGSLDCTLKFWDLISGQCIGTIDWIRSEGHTRVVRCLQADNWKIVSAGDDKTLKIWSLKTGERFVTLHKHTDGVTCLQFDDVMIVSGSYDKTVKVWNFLPS